MTITTAKFESGKTYYTTWNEDTGREHLSRYTIQKRTAKTVTINGRRFKIYYWDNFDSEAVRVSYGKWILAKDVYCEQAQAEQDARDIAWTNSEYQIRERAKELATLDDYIVTADAQQIAIDAEIDNAKVESLEDKQIRLYDQWCELNHELQSGSKARRDDKIFKLNNRIDKLEAELVTVAAIITEQNAAIEFAVTTDAQNSAVDAEIDNSNNNDVLTEQKNLSRREYDEFQTAAKLIAADVEHIESLRDCCKPNSARHQFYNQILKDSDAPIKEFNKKYCDAIDRYNKSLLPTDTERQAAKNAVEDIKADYAARGIKFIAKVYYYPHGVEGEPMEVFSCECKSWLDAVEFVNREFIDGQYVDGIYFAGNVIENIDGDVIPPPYDLESPDVDTDAETYSYKTNRGNIRTLKVGETGSNVKSRWYYYHEIAGLPESGVIELSIDSNGDDFTNQLCKFIATDTDGSEDDIDDDIFDLLPTVDELNDVSEFAPVQSIISTKVIVDDEGNEFKHVLIGEERISYLNGEINNIYSGKYRAWFDYYFSRYGIQYIKGGVTCGAKSFGDEEEFFSEMERRGACSIDKPESTTLDTLAAIAETCQNLNANAPEGWEIYFDTENNFFPIEFNGKQVTKLDSLATQNFLSPQKFFERFRPLVDKNYTPKQQFIDERLLELDNLQAMRVEIGNDTERLKILDDLIEQTKRDICELEFAS